MDKYFKGAGMKMTQYTLDGLVRLDRLGSALDHIQVC